MSKAFRALRIAAVPLLFAAVALGLATVHVSQERKAERARMRATHAAQLQDAGNLAGYKLQDLAPAAKKGDYAAEVEMARRLALGEGVKKDEGQAAAYFQIAVDQLGEIGAHDKRAQAAATACRFLARFYRRGVPAANIAANASYAFDLLHKAASYFGDPIAQYELAKLLIDGDGIARNTRQGAGWLQMASRKGYAPAQALLGEMLWRGNGLKRAPGEGLGLLGIARRNASPADKAWVSKMFEAARAEALPIEILEANAFMVQQSGASPFNWPDGGFLDGDYKPGAAAGAKGAAVAAEQRAREHRNPLAASRRAGASFLGLDGGEGAQKTGESRSAGIIQMYRLWGLQGAGEHPAPVRLSSAAN